MSLIALATLSVLVVMASSDLDHLPPKVYYDIENARPLFEDFIKEYNREYRDEADKELHFQAFLKNLKKINEQNAKSTSAVFGINNFADYTEEESKNLFGLGLRLPAK